MILQFAVVAQSVSIDRFTNRLSLFNTYERIEAPRFPFVLGLVLVTTMRREAGDPEIFDLPLSVRLAENTIAQGNMHIDFERMPATRNIVNLQALPIIGPGDLTFSFNVPPVNTPVVITVPVVQVQVPV
jgi:hypothetical protein